MPSVISMLYHGELHPKERDFSDSSRADILTETAKDDVAWLNEHLDGKAKEKLAELVDIWNDMAGMIGYESFHEGFILGANFVMEACCGIKERDR